VSPISWCGLEPPPGKYFVLTEQEKKDAGAGVVPLAAPDPAWRPAVDRRLHGFRPGESVRIDQPHCAFVPRVTTLFPGLFRRRQRGADGASSWRSRNSSAIRHSIQWGPEFPEPRVHLQHSAPTEGAPTSSSTRRRRPLFIGLRRSRLDARGAIWIFDHPFPRRHQGRRNFRDPKNVPTDVETDRQGPGTNLGVSRSR